MVAALSQQRDEHRTHLVQVLQKLGEVAGEVLGINDAVKCFKSGDFGSCAQTALTVIAAGGAGIAGKFLAKYGNPFKIGRTWKLIHSVYDLIKTDSGTFRSEEGISKELNAKAAAETAPKTIATAKT
jgi:hypothetical protein